MAGKGKPVVVCQCGHSSKEHWDGVKNCKRCACARHSEAGLKAPEESNLTRDHSFLSAAMPCGLPRPSVASIQQ